MIVLFAPFASSRLPRKARTGEDLSSVNLQHTNLVACSLAESRKAVRRALETLASGCRLKPAFLLSREKTKGSSVKVYFRMVFQQLKREVGEQDARSVGT